MRRATILVLSAKAVCIADGEGILHSERAAIPVPLVVRLTHFVRVPYRPYVGLSRRAIFARDGGRCAYCRGAAETIDHVVPRSRGGAHTWDNVVAACRPCNLRKADRSLRDCGLHLPVPPGPPRRSLWVTTSVDAVPAHWEPYLAA